MGEITREAVKLFGLGGDAGALLLFLDGRLAAVISQLEDGHDALTGLWFVEACIGWEHTLHPLFPNAEAAEAWVISNAGGQQGSGAIGAGKSLTA